MSWPPPQYDDPIKRGPALLAIELTILPLALFCLAARMYVRAHILRSTWWDDWCMIAAGICCAGVTVSVILGKSWFGPPSSARNWTLAMATGNADVILPERSEPIVWVEHSRLGCAVPETC